MRGCGDPAEPFTPQAGRRESVSGPARCFPELRAREPLGAGASPAHAHRTGASLVRFSRRGRLPQPPLLVGSVVMEPLDELDLLLLEEDGGAEDVPRAEL